MPVIKMVWLTLTCLLHISISSCKGQPEKPVFVYEVRPATTTGTESKMIILLHGLGSDEQDLFSLTHFIPTNFTVVSARAPHSHNGSGYAWYAVDFSSGKPVGNTEQTEKSRQELLVFIQQMSDKYSIKKGNIILAGFSQGAIMSYSVAFSSPETVNKIACFGGRILEQTKSALESSTDPGSINCFIAHGTQDQMISVNDARDAKTVLTAHKVNLSYHEYNVGHTIDREMLADFIKWLDTIK